MTTAKSILTQLRALVAALEAMPEDTSFDVYQVDDTGQVLALETLLPTEPAIKLGMITHDATIGEVGTGEYASRDTYDEVLEKNRHRDGELTLADVGIVLVQRVD